MPKRRNNNKNGDREILRASQLADDISDFEQFREEILPALRADLKAGLDAESIYRKYQAYAAARGVTIAMTSNDEGKALTAIKDVLDRVGGKATEKREVEHRFNQLSDQELDAVVLTELGDWDEIKTREN